MVEILSELFLDFYLIEPLWSDVVYNLTDIATYTLNMS